MHKLKRGRTHRQNLTSQFWGACIPSDMAVIFASFKSHIDIDKASICW